MNEKPRSSFPIIVLIAMFLYAIYRLPSQIYVNERHYMWGGENVAYNKCADLVIVVHPYDDTMYVELLFTTEKNKNTWQEKSLPIDERGYIQIPREYQACFYGKSELKVVEIEFIKRKIKIEKLF